MTVIFPFVSWGQKILEQVIYVTVKEQYLESRGVKFLRLWEVFRAVVNVPEEGQDFPALWYEIPCRNTRGKNKFSLAFASR